MGILDIFRKKESNGSMYLYTDEELKVYEEFIESNFGSFDEVIHEIVSPDIHLDIIVIPPTKEQNYYKLITMGMGAYKMNVPSELKKYELSRAELVIYLPADWDIKSSKEEDYWPIRQLKTLARLPIYSNSWLGCTHTISSDEVNSPYASDTDFCSMLLVNAINEKTKDILDLRMKSKGKINFYQLMPLYKEELQYMYENGFDKLINRFDEKDLVPIVNKKRKNYCIDK